MPVIGPFNFRGGYAPGYSFASLPPGSSYAADMKNCRFFNGAIIPRHAQSQVNTTTLGAAYVNGLASWIDAANSKTILVATCNAKIYTADATSYTPGGATIAFTDRTGAVVLSSSASLRYQFDSLNGILVGVGNSAAGGVPIKVTAYNVNAANLGGTPPNGDAVKQVNNFLFIGRQLGAAATYSTVSWSNVVDPETWTAGNSVDFNKKDGEAVTALGSIGTDLYIFKPSSIGRLSTYSQTISGSVTLGPLQTVIRGIGCIGPLAIDNLPNGNIVFLGSDGHLYEFDGSTLLDLSKFPYPGPNAFDSSDFFVHCGLNVGNINTQSIVKVWKGTGEVWVGYDSNASSSSNLFNTFAYDYRNHIWQGYISDTNPKSMCTIVRSNTTTYLEGPDLLFHGNASGLVLGRGQNIKFYPVDEAGTAVDFRLGAVVSLGGQASDFVPRTICFETSNTTAALSTLSVYVVFDTYFSGGGSASQTISGASATRVFVPVKMLQDSVGSNVFPRLLTIEWIGTGTGSGGNEIIRINNFFVSDDFIR